MVIIMSRLNQLSREQGLNVFSTQGSPLFGSELFHSESGSDGCLTLSHQITTKTACLSSPVLMLILGYA